MKETIGSLAVRLMLVTAKVVRLSVEGPHSHPALRAELERIADLVRQMEELT